MKIHKEIRIDYQIISLNKQNNTDSLLNTQI